MTLHRDKVTVYSTSYFGLTSTVAEKKAAPFPMDQGVYLYFIVAAVVRKADLLKRSDSLLHNQGNRA
ncbi:hypothetical protein [Paenibacillus sp. FSL R10-2734]|uniref:hypothetical protein n=1 Tax=Paenibacillus sp. FSL R10-2734 TaxID=2954691 RepID=UPI0030DA62B7